MQFPAVYFTAMAAQNKADTAYQARVLNIDIYMFGNLTAGVPPVQELVIKLDATAAPTDLDFLVHTTGTEWVQIKPEPANY
jgi:hypothetical protein